MGQKVVANVVRVNEALVYGECGLCLHICMWPGPRLTENEGECNYKVTKQLPKS